VCVCGCDSVCVCVCVCVCMLGTSIGKKIVQCTNLIPRPQMCTYGLVSFLDTPRKAEGGSSVLGDISCHSGLRHICKECHNCIFESRT